MHLQRGWYNNGGQRTDKPDGGQRTDKPDDLFNGRKAGAASLLVDSDHEDPGDPEGPGAPGRILGIIRADGSCPGSQPDSEMGFCWVSSVTAAIATSVKADGKHVRFRWGWAEVASL